VRFVGMHDGPPLDVFAGLDHGRFPRLAQNLL
jgi:hypothetical protein